MSIGASEMMIVGVKRYYYAEVLLCSRPDERMMPVCVKSFRHAEELLRTAFSARKLRIEQAFGDTGLHCCRWQFLHVFPWLRT